MKNQYTNLLAHAEKLHRHNRQGSYKTKERYFEAYQRFLRYLADVYHLEKIANISGKHLSGYVVHMQEKGCSASTIKTDLSAIRFWHDQIPGAKYQLPDNAEFDLARRTFGGVDRAWSHGEYVRMVAELWRVQKYDYASCLVLARYAALRLHEVMRIDTAIARAALKNGFVTIKGKGGKVRTVPIDYPIEVELRRLLEQTSPGHKLFVPEGKQTHIAKSELQNFISSHRKAVQDPGSSRPLTFHGLRHTCAAEWYQRLIAEGRPKHQAMLQVSRWLGHERADVTRIYLAGLEGGDGDV